jgi:selenocysteine-specific elongation factor
MHVIGTAGHVDHGKSTLIESMTGMNPDRLKEERERQMTIDLGFAWMELPSGEPVGIVDVPGHRDFIENMLAGIGGIDAALFVIAADEGVMPQTREHLAILDLLQINGGIVALTKIDLVEDEDWIELVEEDIRATLRGTVLEGAPIIRVSAIKSEGIPLLLEGLDEMLVERPPRQDLGRPRLPVDRAFSIAGFGTVVTGTLSDGHLQVGEEVEILPQETRARIRGLQTHKQKEEVALPGSRTAVNLTGVALEDLGRGDVLAHVGDYKSTRRIDAKFRQLADVSKPIKHNTEVKLFVGAAEVLARVRTLGRETIKPNEVGWLQIETKHPIVVIRGDHYILRRPSPGETLGGGIVIDAHPGGRHKRFSEQVINRLEALAEGDPADILFQSLASLTVAPLKEVTIHSNLDEAAALEAFEQLLLRGEIVFLEERKGDVGPESDVLVTTRGYWEQLGIITKKVIDDYHEVYPLRKGMPKEELKSRLQVSNRLFISLIRIEVKDKQLDESGPLIYRAGHEIRFTPQQEKAVNSLLVKYSASPYSPPSVKDSKSEVGEEVFQALVELDILMPVSNEVVFRREDYDLMVSEIVELLQKNGTMSAAQLRDHFNTTRRYMLALLEHLDEIGVTVREGDVRRLK